VPISAADRTWRLRACLVVANLRRGLAVGGAVYAMACIAYFALPIFRAERVHGSAIVRVLHLAIDPMLALITSIISFELTYQNFNFLLIGLALLTYILQQVVTGRLESLETWIRKPLLAKPATTGIPVVTAAQTRAIAQSGAQQASRMSLLRDYAAAKRILTEVKKELAFLSIDIVGSTKLKVGEDKIVVEHAFTEYKKFLDRIFREFRAYKVAWTPDGVMSCFSSVEDAAAAARKLLAELDWFNRDVHQLRARFHVRCGLNVGEVLVPDNKPLEEISDEAIDVAGHMQKFADVDSLWISGEAFQHLVDRENFTKLDKQVDNREVYAWRRAS
jgi:class 3 adenylate cyclase